MRTRSPLTLSLFASLVSMPFIVTPVTHDDSSKSMDCMDGLAQTTSPHAVALSMRVPPAWTRVGEHGRRGTARWPIAHEMGMYLKPDLMRPLESVESLSTLLKLRNATATRLLKLLLMTPVTCFLLFVFVTKAFLT